MQMKLGEDTRAHRNFMGGMLSLYTDKKLGTIDPSRVRAKIDSMRRCDDLTKGEQELLALLERDLALFCADYEF